MPPKRKRRDDTPSGSDESDVISTRRPTATTLLPEVMQNIERLKAKRDRSRKTITTQFEAYAAQKKKDIGAHYASKAQERSSKAKELLDLYAAALEKRASIEKSIEDLVLNAREDLRELSIVLGAAYSGRQQQASAAIGSFASPTLPSSAKGASTTNSGYAPQKVGTERKAREDRDDEEDLFGGFARADNSARNVDAKTQYEKRASGNPFDQILW